MAIKSNIMIGRTPLIGDDILASIVNWFKNNNYKTGVFAVIISGTTNTIGLVCDTDELRGDAFRFFFAAQEYHEILSCTYRKSSDLIIHKAYQEMTSFN